MENKMPKVFPTMVVIFLVSLSFMFSFSQANANEVSGNDISKPQSAFETYIVIVTKPEGGVTAQSQDIDSWYRSFLPVGVSSSNHQQRLIHSYRNVVDGFAAKLTAEEAKAMREKDGFMSARPQKILTLRTTRSPKFLGLQQNLGIWNYSHHGKGVIIGVLDTGISPDHPSFSDERMPPPPAKWRGKCDFNGTRCNNKLIGARNFVADENTTMAAPPFDDEGHGTHTASTAAGNFVNGANVFGYAAGRAIGMAPLAHLAIYKVCSDYGCAESDILAAMDAAIEDGVDVLSLSIGGSSAPFFEDGIAVGAFRAIQKGIFVSCSAGNDGPVNSSLSNEAPWILTVGASTVDRMILAGVALGNNQKIFGESVFQPRDFVPTFLPLVYAGKNGSQMSAFCAPGSLTDIDVKGKIVLCERGGGIGRIEKGQEVKDAGGAGMILMNDELNGYSILSDAHVLPASHVSYADGERIKAYINTTTSPVAKIVFLGTLLGGEVPPMVPMVASFSSRGPSLASPGILKPDIIGPGVNILAAWPFSVENKTNTKSTFNIISGTSMSCPHLSGIAALLKSAHPDWSPAAIKSAIMTTADTVNSMGEPILNEKLVPADILAIGAGHVNPSEASDPGLVYDIQPEDYIPYLCGLHYTEKDISYIVQHKVNCSAVSSIPEAQLNYPSFSVVFGPKTQTYSRAVTNVGPAYSSYFILVTPPPGVNVSVTPSKLVFTNVKQTATYSVTFSKTTEGNSGRPFAQGNLKWVSDQYLVRSPILVLFSNQE